MTRLATLGLISLALVLGCKDEVDLLDSLANTPTSVVLGVDTITISAVATRGVGPDEVDPGLAVNATTHPDTASLIVDQLWVVHGNEVWETEPYRASPSDSGPGSNNWITPSGPEWPAGDEVYVVVELRRVSGGGSVRIRSLPVTITPGP